MTEAPDVPSPSEVDPILLGPPSAGIHARSSAQRPGSIKLPVSPTELDSVSRQSGTKIGLVRFSPGLLSRPVDMQIDISKPVVAMGLPSSMARLDLQLDGQEFQLYFGADAVDAMTGFRHVAMSVLNDTTATARFTISRDGRRIYGVLRTSASTYLLEPSETPGEQIIYRYPKTFAVDDRRHGLIGNSQLARRHHQLEAVAELRPDYSYSDAFGAYLIGGNLGTVKLISSATFVRSAERLSSITQFTGTEKFELVATQLTNDGGRLAIFRQVIDGIPVAAVNEMLVDRNGKIRRLATSIVPSDVPPMRPLLSASEAEARAIVQWEARYGKSKSKLRPEAPLNVQYWFNRTAMTLEPFFDFTLIVDGDFSRFHARVDAVSGRLELANINRKVSYTSCVDAAVIPGSDVVPPALSDCQAPNARRGYAAPDRGGYCSESTTYPPTVHCGATRPKTVAQVMRDIRSTLPGAIATNAPGTPSFDLSSIIVIQGSRVPGLDSAETRDGLILMPSTQSSSEEILAHEMAHVYVNVYNNTVLETDQNVFAGAVREGTAYTFAGLLGAITGRTDRYGTPWMFGDGQYYAGSTMSASDPNFQYWQDIAVPAGGHKSGQVIYRFFRRIQEIAGISNQRKRVVVAPDAVRA